MSQQPVFLTQLTVSQAYPQDSNLVCFHAKTEDKPWVLGDQSGNGHRSPANLQAAHVD